MQNNKDFIDHDREYDPDMEHDKQTMFSNLRRLCGRQLTEMQELRIARLIDMYGMSGIFEFQYMTVMWEYYLSQNKELLDHHVNYIEELLNTQCTDSIANKLETLVSARLTEAVIEQSERRTREAVNASNSLKYALFLLTFSVFGVLFFVAGLLAHGKGLPAWMAYSANGSESLTGALISLVLGMPVGWILWIGGGLISVFCMYQYVKNNPLFSLEDYPSVSSIFSALLENNWRLFFFLTSLLIIYGIIAWLS